jgi:hypothetical protein
MSYNTSQPASGSLLYDNEWSHGICDCCSDCGECMFAYFCIQWLANNCLTFSSPWAFY